MTEGVMKVNKTGIIKTRNCRVIPTFTNLSFYVGQVGEM